MAPLQPLLVRATLQQCPPREARSRVSQLIRDQARAWMGHRAPLALPPAGWQRRHAAWHRVGIDARQGSVVREMFDRRE